MCDHPSIKRALRIIIIGQCAGLIGPLLFGNGFMLAYFSKLGIADYRILFLFALIPLISMAFILPLSYLADCVGKRKLGEAGLVVSIAGFVLLPLAAFIPHSAQNWLTFAVLLYSVGNAAFDACWFALLSPIVPEKIRGRWLGQMRTAYQVTSILFSLGLALLLRHRPELYVYQLVLAVMVVLAIARLLLYMQIPELDPVCPPRDGFWYSLGRVLRIRGYMPFCSYIFILSFLTGAVPGLLGLLEKQSLGFSDSQLVLMGNLLSIGTVAGFLTGGKMVDHAGTKPVFLTGHLVFALSLTGVLLRGFMPLPTAITIGFFSFLFGAMQGAVSIASTSELLALIPKENKSLSTGFNVTLMAAGTSLAGLSSGQLLKLNILQPEWNFSGQTMGAYDTILAGFMLLIILMAATLGLVPTIKHLRSQWLPQNR